MTRKNVFIIHTHDSGRLLSPYGEAVPTPFLRVFAGEGTLFRNCFCGSPTCSPSRASMLTGTYPHQNGMLGLAHRGFALHTPRAHMASYFRKEGFHTVLCGIQHEAHDARMLGYERIVGQQGYDMGNPYSDMTIFDHDNTDALCKYLVEYNGRRPLFVSMGFYNTHRVFPIDDGSVNPEYIAPPKCLYDSKRNREDMAGFHRSVKIVDDCFGRLIAMLKKLGYYKNSIIIFTTDHGPAFPRMKCTLYDGGIGVGFILYYPDNPSNGKVYDSMISHLDLFPTLCELEGIEPPTDLEGKSILPLLENKYGPVHEEIFAEVNYHASYQPMRCIRTERYKFIRNYLDYRKPILSNIDECESKAFLMENGLRNRLSSSEELYDLYFDPAEQNNLFGKTNYKDVQKHLEERLDAWMVITNDPLLNAPIIPKPVGALINKITCEDPGLPDWENEL